MTSTMKDRRNQLPRRPLPRPIQGTTPPEGLGSPPAPGIIGTMHHRTIDVTERQITCPNCATDIKLTESLAAPLIADARSLKDPRRLTI
jgi:hypothetical protein